MGVPKFYRWVSERYPCLSQVIQEHQVRLKLITRQLSKINFLYQKSTQIELVFP